MADPVQVLLDVLPVVGDAGRGDHGVAEQLKHDSDRCTKRLQMLHSNQHYSHLKADLPAEEIWDVPLLPPLVHLGEHGADLAHALVALNLDLLNLRGGDK